MVYSCFANNRERILIYCTYLNLYLHYIHTYQIPELTENKICGRIRNDRQTTDRLQNDYKDIRKQQPSCSTVLLDWWVDDDLPGDLS